MVRKVWRPARPAAFSYEVEVEGFRSGTYRVTVEGEEVLSVDAGPEAERYRIYPAPTPDFAFAALDEALALLESGEISEGSASAAFDPASRNPLSNSPSV